MISSPDQYGQPSAEKGLSGVEAPSKIFLEHLRSDKYISGISYMRPEAWYGGSRFDFY